MRVADKSTVMQPWTPWVLGEGLAAHSGATRVRRREPCVDVAWYANWTSAVRGPMHLTHLVDGLARAPTKGAASCDNARVDACSR